MNPLKIIGLEEHFVTPAALRAWNQLDPQWQDAAKGVTEAPEIKRLLSDLGPERFALMDQIGLNVQVLSLTAPGLHGLAPADAAALQQDTTYSPIPCAPTPTACKASPRWPRPPRPQRRVNWSGP